MAHNTKGGMSKRSHAYHLQEWIEMIQFKNIQIVGMT